jgi:Glyoxalase-like domain
VVLDAHDPGRVARFWSGLLGRELRPESSGALVPGTATQVGLRFVASDGEQVGARRLHFHLTSESLEEQKRTVEHAVELGGRLRDFQDPEDDFVVVLDPEGNELCVIEPRNGFLAGTGFLGEVSCDGTRDVGVFWSGALAWPLVWDDNEETAVQSPLGGTKVSWGGPPVEPKHGRNRQRFDLVTDDDLGAEIERLVSLGATRLGAAVAGGVELADPDGNEFGLSRG